MLVPLLPDGAVIYTVEHRGLGRSMPLSNGSESAVLRRFAARNDNAWLLGLLGEKQSALGTGVPLVRILRAENASRDLIRAILLVNQQVAEAQSTRNYLYAVSYGTVIAQRAMQIRPDLFTAALLDGLAAAEKVEESVKSDALIEEFCRSLPNCTALLQDNGAGSVRELLGRALDSQTPCTRYFRQRFSKTGKGSLCDVLHSTLNLVLLQSSRNSLKGAIFPLLSSMTTCSDEASFFQFADALHAQLAQALPRQLPPVESVNDQVPSAERIEANLNVNELVFELVSAIERFNITESGVNVCFQKQGPCPNWVFDPCHLFRKIYKRKEELFHLNHTLPRLSLSGSPLICPKTRVLVLAGSLDFQTPTYLTRGIVDNQIQAQRLEYLEFFGRGHGIFGFGECDVDIFSDFLNGTMGAPACVDLMNQKTKQDANQLLSLPLGEIARRLDNDK